MTPMTAPEPDEYSAAPCLYLTEDQVEALGLKLNPPAAGSSIGIRAVAKVITKVENADTDGDGDGIDVALTLQITDMEVTGAALSTNPGAMLYGNS